MVFLQDGKGLAVENATVEMKNRSAVIGPALMRREGVVSIPGRAGSGDPAYGSRAFVCCRAACPHAAARRQHSNRHTKYLDRQGWRGIDGWHIGACVQVGVIVIFGIPKMQPVLSDGELTRTAAMEHRRGVERLEQITKHDIRGTGINLEPVQDFMPFLGPMAGYAVTVVIQPGDPAPKQQNPKGVERIPPLRGLGAGPENCGGAGSGQAAVVRRVLGRGDGKFSPVDWLCGHDH